MKVFITCQSPKSSSVSQESKILFLIRIKKVRLFIPLDGHYQAKALSTICSFQPQTERQRDREPPTIKPTHHPEIVNNIHVTTLWTITSDATSVFTVKLVI